MSPATHQFLIAGNNPELEVTFPAGTLRIEEGDTDSITVDIETKRPELFSVEQVHDVVVVSYDNESRRWVDAKAIVSITVPPTTAVRTRLASANLRVTGTVASLSAKSASGNIVVDTIVEDFRVKVASGDVRSQSVGGVCDIKSASGNTFLGNVEGEAGIKSASGDIRIGSANGAVQAISASGKVSIGSSSSRIDTKTASGAVNVETYSGHDITIKTVSGNARVAVPVGTRADLKTKTLSGSIKLPEKAAPFDGERTMRSIDFKSVSGNLT